MEEREEINETGNRFADGLLMPIFAVGAVFLFIILCFYAYNNVMKNKNNSDQVVILDGDTGDFKVAPADPGGMEVEHTDKEVFNTITGQQENIEEGKVNIEPTEVPVIQDQIVADAAAQEPSDVPVVPEGDQEATETQAVSQNTGAAEVPEEPEDPTHTIKAEKIADPFAKTTVPAETWSQRSEEKIDTAPAVNDSEVFSVKEEAPVQKSVTRTESGPTVKTEIKKETDKKTGESKTVIEFKEKPKSMGGSGSAAAKGAYYVQVSSHSTRSEAEATWIKFISDHSSDVGDRSSNITEATVSGKTFYRLSFGPFADRSTASTKCGILKAKGQDCIVQKY